MYYHWENGGTEPEDVADLMQQMVFEFLDQEPCMPGQIVPYITTDAPDHTLPMDGSTYDAADYPALWDVLDSAYKNVDDTFTLPNMNDKYLAQAGGAQNQGDIAGSNTVTLTTGEMPAHTHGDSDYLHPVPFASAPGPTPTATPAILTAGNTGSSGGGGAHENRPETLFVKFAVTAW